ncbi:MAG: helix-turn-helix transcriptional regulator [Bacillota bacterium]|nr:helix-turn-helix transcriptional regulator [Bacillota bacterium]
MPAGERREGGAGDAAKPRPEPESGPSARQLGERLRRFRLERRLSLYDVERLTGKHFSTIGRYERGERRPDLETLRELAGAYGVSLAEVLGDSSSLVAYLPRDLRETAGLLLDRPDLRRLVQAAAPLEPPLVDQLSSLLRALTRGASQGSSGPAPG